MNRKSFLKTLGLVAASPTLIREVVEEPVKPTMLSIPNGSCGQVACTDGTGKITWVDLDIGTELLFVRDPIFSKTTEKDISAMSYRYNPSDRIETDDDFDYKDDY